MIRRALLASFIAFALGLPGLHADDFEFKGPAGKVSELFNLYNQRIRGYPSYQERLDLELQEDLTNNTYGARLTPWGWWRLPEALGALPAPNKAYFEVKEGWLERISPEWDLRVGNQILAWGAGDQINPTDVWNPRDLYDPLAAPKLPIVVARLKIHPTALENFNIELDGTPFFRSTRLPVTLPTGETAVNVTDSRWLISMPNNLVAGGLAAPLLYTITQPNYPATWQAGARMQVLRVGGWDFSGSYYNGVESTPRFAITRKGATNNPSLPVIITLNPSFHRQQMLGTDGAGSVSIGGHDVGTRYEMAYFIRDNSRALNAAPEFRQDLIRDNYFHGVFGIDYTFPKEILGTVLYVNSMYVLYRRVQGKETQTGQLLISGLPDTVPWDSNAVLYVEDRIGSKFKLTAMGIYSSSHGDGYLSPGAQYSYTDNLKLTLGADFFVGNVSGFYGQFHDNNRVNFGMSYVF